MALRLFRSLEYLAKEVFYPAIDGADSALFIRRDAGKPHSTNSADQNIFLTEMNVNTDKTAKWQFIRQINDLKIIYFCTFVILFTIGNLLILLSYKPRGINKVKLLLVFNILSFLLMKVRRLMGSTNQACSSGFYFRIE